MQTVKSVSWVRMVLAFAAVLVVAGSGVALAVGPDPTYVPKFSTLTGLSTVAHGATTGYVLNVTFTNNSTASFPPTTGATFTAALGSFSPTTLGSYTAPPASAGPRDRVTGTFSQNGVTTSASRIISLSP